MTKKTKPDIVTAMSHPKLFRPYFDGDSWNPWRAVLKAAYALPMSDDEIEFFRSVAERDPPKRRVRECWFIVGRRGGKDAIASLITAHAAAFFDQQARLRRGERALCLCLACDREQSKVLLNYIRSYFADIPPLAAMVRRETANGFELTNGVDVTIATNDFRTVRGRAILSCTLDECAYYRSENSAAPDTETYNAVTPGTATLPGAMIIGISSPYKPSGLLFDKFAKHYGKDDDDVLVIRAPSIVLNPTLDQKFIDAEIAADPAAKRAEWLAEWRSDIASLLDPALIDACVVAGRHELLPRPDMRAVAFLDAASGVGKDAMALAIAYQDILTDCAVLACIREWQPPFSPELVCGECSDTLKRYNISRVTSDRYSLNWTAEALRRHQITLEYSTRSKSDVYRELLPLIATGTAELLDNKKLRSQLCGLERRLSRATSHETIDVFGGDDAVSNVCAGALVLAGEGNGGAVCGAIGVGPSRFAAPTSDEQWRRLSLYICGDRQKYNQT